MPYLHWETSGRRARMAKAVRAVLKEEEAKNGPLKHRSNRSATMRQNLQKYKVQFQPPKHDPRELVEKWKEKREELV